MTDKQLKELQHFLKEPLLINNANGQPIKQSFNKYIERLKEVLLKNNDEFKVFPLDPLGDIIRLVQKPLEDILITPKYEFKKVSYEEKSYKVKQIDKLGILKTIERAPGRTIKEKMKFSRTLPAIESIKDYDSYENRFVKKFVIKFFELLEKRIDNYQWKGLSREIEVKRYKRLKKIYNDSPIKDLSLNKPFEINNTLLYHENYSKVLLSEKKLKSLKKDEEMVEKAKYTLLGKLVLFTFLSKLYNNNCYWLEKVYTDEDISKDFKIVIDGKLNTVDIKKKKNVLRLSLNKIIYKLKIKNSDNLIEVINNFTENIKTEIVGNISEQLDEQKNEKDVGDTIGFVPYSLSPVYSYFKDKEDIEDVLETELKYSMDYISKKSHVNLYPFLPLLIDSSDIDTISWFNIFNENISSINLIKEIYEKSSKPDNIVYSIPDGINYKIKSNIYEMFSRYFTKVKFINNTIASILWYGQLKKNLKENINIHIIDLLSPIPTVSIFEPVIKRPKNQPLYFKRIISKLLEEIDEDDEDGEDKNLTKGRTNIIDEIDSSDIEILKSFNKLQDSNIEPSEYDELIEKYKKEYIKDSDKLFLVDLKENHSYETITKKQLLIGINEFIRREKYNLISYEELYPEIRILAINEKNKFIDIRNNKTNLDTFTPEWGKTYNIIKTKIKLTNSEVVYIPIFVKSPGYQKEQIILATIKNTEGISRNGVLTIDYKFGDTNPYYITFTTSNNQEIKCNVYDDISKIIKINEKKTQLYPRKKNISDYKKIQLKNKVVYPVEVLKKYLKNKELNDKELKGKLYGSWISIFKYGGIDINNTGDKELDRLIKRFETFVNEKNFEECKSLFDEVSPHAEYIKSNEFSNSYKTSFGDKDFKKYYELAEIFAIRLNRDFDSVLNNLSEENITSYMKKSIKSLKFTSFQIEWIYNKGIDEFSYFLINRTKGIIYHIIILLSLLSKYGHIEETNESKLILLFSLIRISAFLNSVSEIKNINCNNNIVDLLNIIFKNNEEEKCVNIINNISKVLLDCLWINWNDSLIIQIESKK